MKVTKEQLIEQIAKGHTMKEAAAELGVSFGSVAWGSHRNGLSFAGNGGQDRLLRERGAARRKAKPDKRLQRIEAINRQIARLEGERRQLWEELT